MTRGSRILGFAVRIAFVGLFSLVALGGIFELYLRKTGFLEAQPANYPCIAGDAVLNHVFHPNCEGIAAAAALKTDRDVTYKTNDLGIRGHEPVPGKKSIVVVGDSYTEGFGLNEPETFPAQLEQGILANGLRDWQVLNGGTLGFTPALYPKYFDRYFLELKPEIVILNLDFTDFNDDPYYLQMAEYDPLGNPSAFPGRDIFPAWSMGYVYSNKSALVRFLHQEANQYALAMRRDEIQPAMDRFVQKRNPLVLLDDLKATGLEGCQKAAEAVAKNIFSLKRRVEAAGGVLMIHMYPPGYLVKSYGTVPQNISFVRVWDQKQRKDFSWACGSGPKMVDVFRSVANRNGIQFFDSFPVIMSAPEKEKLYFDGDAHWNRDGVKLVTGALSKQLLPLLKKRK